MRPIYVPSVSEISLLVLQFDAILTLLPSSLCVCENKKSISALITFHIILRYMNKQNHIIHLEETFNKFFPIQMKLK